MARRKQLREIHLQQFGSVRGLDFRHGGRAEIVMTYPEIGQLLEAWSELETQKSKTDSRIIAALDFLSHKCHLLDAAIVALVPIAQERAKIVPILDESME